MFNPYQDNLIRQKAMIEQQLQQLNQVPPININNQFSQPQLPQSNNFDFNGKWVSNENEARQTVNNNLPLILFDKENPLFYMKGTDGTLKKYSFQEITETQETNQLENKVNELDLKFNRLIDLLEQKGEKTNESTKKPDGKQYDRKHHE